MGKSQLKRLKASLRSAGITGQQKSKKASKQRKQTGNDSRLDKNVALQSIREEFNPFELKTNRVKYAIGGRERVKGAQGRPGLSKQIGEENRKKTLLVEMQRRNKAGGIVDRRFGENDPTMAPEDRMLERFTREKQKRVRGGDLFNLEDDDELTHFGQSLGGLTDDFDAGNNPLLEESSDTESLTKAKKRRLGPDDENSEDDDAPERKKTKAEVMKEVIAKSKLHKYERQKAKEDDEEEREKLDAQMGDIWALLGAQQPTTMGHLGTSANSEPILSREKEEINRNVHPDRVAQMEDNKDKEYDAAVREMIFDKRSKPAERTKSEEERAQEESERLRKLEEARQKRMRGEEVSDDEQASDGEGDDDLESGDTVEYGFGKGIPRLLEEQRTQNPEEFLDGDYEISEDGYVDVGEDGGVDGNSAELSDDFDSNYSGATEYGDKAEDSEEDEFVADVLGGKKPAKSTADVLGLSRAPVGQNDKLAFTFPCPQTHQEMLEMVKDIPVEDLPTVVQRIRVLYHPKLQVENKTKLANFSAVLLEHILHVANVTAPKIPFQPLEVMIRHLHALAKSYPEKSSEAFRDHLKILHEKRTNTDMNAGDLILLTAISTIFPTSDHFHPVVTPAMIVIAKWLDQVVPDSVERLAMGTYLVTLCVQYQKLSKRFIPEAIDRLLQTLALLSPTAPLSLPRTFPYHDSTSLRVSKSSAEWTPRKLSFTDIFDAQKDTKLAILHTTLSLLSLFSSLYLGKSSFTEAFTPVSKLLSHLSTTMLPASLNQYLSTVSTTITTALTRSRKLRRPLELHHHRPLPIPSNIPKFEESYSLDKKSYDPDRDRAELAKLKAQHKKERKGALRELRKDSAFIAREKLREDKKSSKEYHEKMRRLQAMIQSEEGAAANEYKRRKAKK